MTKRSFFYLTISCFLLVINYSQKLKGQKNLRNFLLILNGLYLAKNGRRTIKKNIF